MKRILGIIIALMILAGCGKEGAVDSGKLYTDSEGRQVAVNAVSPRTVALSASIAEIWLEAGGELIGTTDDAFEERGLLETGEAEVVGTIKTPNVETILSLSPDLVLLAPDIAGHVEAAAVLEDAGVSCFYVDATSFESYDETMMAFTEMTEKPENYEKYVTRPKAAIEDIITAAKEKEQKSVLLLRAYSSGVKVKNTGTAAEMLDEFGAGNIASNDKSLPENLSLEKIYEEDPQFVFIVTMGDNEAEIAKALDEFLFSDPIWSELSAVKNGHVVYLPKDLFHYKPNGRWEEAYSYLYEELYS